MNGHLETVYVAVGNGAHVNIRNSEGFTALNQAISSNSNSNAIYSFLSVELLVKNSADINSLDSDGNTPLQKAVEVDLVGMVEVLISLGANVNILSRSGVTALKMAASVSSEISVYLLIAAGGTETGFCECSNGSAISEVGCPVSDMDESVDYCQNCESGYQLYDNKCGDISLCDNHVCLENRICLIENGEPTCSEFYCGENPKSGGIVAVGITEAGDIGCKTRTHPRCTEHSDTETCKQALRDNTLPSLAITCGQEYSDHWGISGYSNALTGAPSYCTYHRDLQAQKRQHVCILNVETNSVYGIGFNQDTKDFFCLADESWNCKEYAAGEYSVEDGLPGENACYRDLLNDNWVNLMTCGNEHRNLWGCSGYDGCGSGAHWCKYFDENFGSVFEQVCSCGGTVDASGVNCYIKDEMKTGSCRNCVTEIENESLIVAARLGDEKCVHEIIANGINGLAVDVNLVESGGDEMTALHAAIVNENAEMIRILASDPGFDVDGLTGDTLIALDSTNPI